MPESYKEDGRPAQQWYWDDWFSAFDVRLCSVGARGVWIDMLGIMYKAEIRGTLTVNGRQINSKTLAKIVGETMANTNKYLKELEEQDVFSRLEDNTIICRRMFRESGRKDQISKIRSEAGKKGAEIRWQPDSKEVAKMATSSSIASSSVSPTSLKPKEDIYTIIKHWNSQKIKNLEERETNIRKKTISKIQKQLKDYSLNEISEAITNYSIILKGDKYFFSYSWQLWEFLDRGLVNFLTKNDPIKNYISNKEKGITKEEQRKKDLDDWTKEP